MKRYSLTQGVYGVLAILVGFFLCMTTSVSAAEKDTKMVTTDYCSNLNYTQWESVTRENLFLNEDQTLGRFVCTEKNELYVETYDTSLTLIEQKSIPFELSQFGGFFCGAKYFWVVFGQDNLKEEDGKEVVRIVKYSKDWKRLSSASYCSSSEWYFESVYQPFHASDTSFSEYRDFLYIRFGRSMHKSFDGKNHQSNFTIRVNQNTMNIEGDSVGYVSHSFAQRIDATDGTITSVDLGDAYPRALVFFEYGETDLDMEKWSEHETEIYSISQTVGSGYSYNYTGVSLGGYVVTDQKYIVSFCSVDQEDATNQTKSNAMRNIYILTRDRNTENPVWSTQKITSYETSQDIAGTPQLVRINKNKYLLMWEIRNKKNYYSYMFLDENGTAISSIFTKQGCLSKCQPIIWKNQVIWHVSIKNKGVIYYQMDEDGNVKEKPLFNSQIGETVKIKNVYYRITKQVYQSGKFKFETEITKGTKKLKRLLIVPSVKINGVSYKVVSIADKAFANSKYLKYIDTEVKVIGKKAFYNCKRLEQASIDMTTEVKKSAFEGCTNLRYVYANSLRKIGKRSFVNCKRMDRIDLRSKKITKKSVGKSAFKSVNSKCFYWVPKKKKAMYKKILIASGANKKSKFGV